MVINYCIECRVTDWKIPIPFIGKICCKCAVSEFIGRTEKLMSNVKLDKSKFSCYLDEIEKEVIVCMFDQYVTMTVKKNEEKCKSTGLLRKRFEKVLMSRVWLYANRSRFFYENSVDEKVKILFKFWNPDIGDGYEELEKLRVGNSKEV